MLAVVGADAALADAAKRQRAVSHVVQHAVDGDAAGGGVVQDVPRVLAVPGEDVERQRLGEKTHGAGGFAEVVVRHHAQDRREHLLAHQRRVPAAHHHRGLHDTPGGVHPTPAHHPLAVLPVARRLQQRRDARGGGANAAGAAGPRGVPAHQPAHGTLLVGVRDERLRPAAQLLDERLELGAVAKHVLGRDALLPAVERASPHALLGGEREVGGVIHEHGVLSPKLQRARRERLRGFARDDGPHARATGKEHEVQLLAHQLRHDVGAVAGDPGADHGDEARVDVSHEQIEKQRG
mmetsp:Transcript_13859/g.58273  ORF Transcript_13859/g.58273 Transcript_13859/m.58273 type:complete len:294 (-) Transcript_13859:719-1600(-)